MKGRHYQGSQLYYVSSILLVFTLVFTGLPLSGTKALASTSPQASIGVTTLPDLSDAHEQAGVHLGPVESSSPPFLIMEPGHRNSSDISSSSNITSSGDNITSSSSNFTSIQSSSANTTEGLLPTSNVTPGKVTLGTPERRRITFSVNPNGDIEVKQPGISAPGNATSENATNPGTTTDNITSGNVTSGNVTGGSAKVKVPISENVTLGNIKLRFPKDAVPASTEVEFIERTPIDSTGMKMLRLFELNAKDSQSGMGVTQFAKDIEISIQHGQGELDGLDSSSLRLYYLDKHTRQWLPLLGSYDPQTRVLTARTNHFTNFGEQANPLVNGPGRVMAAEVDLHSGASTFSYPIELPPGPGGFQPKLELSYNSGSAEEMKNKRDMGSWVGIGWSLHLGRISQDLITKQYMLDLNGGSYELVSINATEYRTKPDQYFKITRSSDNTTWELLDKEGVYYRFGGTTDSRQYVHDISTEYYRWDMSLMRDTNSNAANVTYVRDLISSNQTVRSAYPEYLSYGGTEIRFISSNNATDTNGDPIRKDNPKSTTGKPAPKVMENRYLDSIEIRFDGNLIRKYGFSYSSTDSINSSDYGGIYYSGTHSLTSITQFGTDNSSLPPMTFGYQNLQTYRHTIEGDYVGNPGNPASFSWPHLTRVNSGYGGEVSFDYSQIPGNNSYDIWTRQAVANKTINGGIGNSNSNAGVEGWWNSAWSTRQKLTFNTTGIGSNLSGFPVLVHLTPGNFTFYSAQWDGGDLRFIDSDNTTLSYEIEKWTSTEAWVWVRVTQLDGNSTSDYIWMYYGNTNAADGWNAAGTWDSNYKMVQHMEETSGTFSDSTSNSNNGTQGGGVSYGVTGKIDGSTGFDGANDYVGVADSPSLDITSALTISAWIKTNTNQSGTYYGIVDKWWDGSTRAYEFSLFGNNLAADLAPPDGGVGDGLVGFQTTDLNLQSGWYYVTLRWSTGGGGTGYIYVNGEASNDTFSKTNSVGNNNQQLRIGSSISGGTSQYFNGTIDEVRISNTARSADWIKAEYISQADILISYGSAENQGTGGNQWGWVRSWRQKITFNTTNITSNLSGFPVLVHLTPGNFDFNYAQSDGGDLLFTDSDDTILSYEIEKWTSTEAWVWVRVPQLDGNSSVDYIWMYYGNTSAADGWNAAGTWDSNYKMVQHMEEASGPFSDSTSNSNNGTQSGGVTSNVTGKIDGAVQFDGVDDYISISSPSFASNQQGTVEFWMKQTALGGYFITYSKPSTGVIDEVRILYDYGDRLSFDAILNTVYSVEVSAPSGAVTPGDWSYGAVTSDGNTIKMYINGVLQTLSLKAGANSGQWYGDAVTDADTFTIGGLRRNGSLAAPYNGIIDEVRVSNVARSADWIKATYFSQTENLVIIGSKEGRGQQVYETHIYSYTGDPKYFGTSWDQEYRGFEEVKETDAAGNYAKHWFYTTGIANSIDSDMMYGKEYKTQWYSTNNTLLREKTYSWNLADSYTETSTWWNSDWSTRRKLTFSTTNITSNLSGFPVLVHLTPGNFTFSSAQSDGGDLRFIDSDNTTLNYEIEKWTSTEAWVWVRVPQLDGNSTSDYIWMYYGNTNAADGWNVAGTWDSNYKMVQHMEEPSGTFYDSTSNGNNGTQGGGVTSNVTGKIDGSTGFDGSNDYVGVADSPSLDITDNLTISAWIKINASQAGTYYGIVDKWWDGSTRAYEFSLFGNNLAVDLAPPDGGIGDGLIYLQTTDLNLQTDRWYYVTLRWSAGGGGTGYIYVNGEASNDTFSKTNSVAANTQQLRIGSSISGGTSQYFNGTIDEVRISNTARSPDWIKAEYLSQKDSLISFGTRAIQLSSTNETAVSKTSSSRYEYDFYGNVKTAYLDGDVSDVTDNSTIHYLYSTNITANIISKVARERVYTGTVASDNGGSSLTKESFYYYDNATSYQTPPTQGNLTRLQQSVNATASVNRYFTYDGHGNQLSSQDPGGSTTNSTYDNTYHIYPQSKTLPVSGLSENYTYDFGTNNLLSITDVNGQTTSYEYDTFKRLIKVIRPGDSSSSPSTNITYGNWGTLYQQHIKTETKIASSNYTWQSDYFDGLGRVVQTQSSGESGNVTISSTTVYNNRGMIDRQYVAQVLRSDNVSGYVSPETSWEYTSNQYDGLGRVTIQTSADYTTVSHDYSTAWSDNVTNERGYKTRDYYDAFQRLVKVEELSDNTTVYATTIYSYDVLGNLIQVKDNNSNNTTMTYDWLSRKIAMTDPDMGSWSYVYDNNGNLTSQTDNKSQTITFSYDALNRLTGKTYPSSANMTNVTYSYDNVTGGNYGKGMRTAMADALGTTAYTYDNRGRLIEENRTVTSDNNTTYTTRFGYDSADRNTWILYPTSENVTQTYNGRGLPYTLSGSTAGNLVTGTLYNQLGLPTQINLNNGLKTTFGYYGLDGTAGDRYGRLWEIKTANATAVLQDVQHTWDAGGNLATRYNVLTSDNETFGYDYLDRLVSVSGAYSDNWTYSTIGNIATHNGTAYSYQTNGIRPHAVTSVGSGNYTYDANGNMLTRPNGNITWDAENRPASMTINGVTTNFTYDGDGNRVQQVITGGQTILYINKYYERNLTTGNVTSFYYLGGRLVAMKQASANATYVHQDHLTGTSVTSTSGGALDSSITYTPFGLTRSGSVTTDIKFTGQRLDGTGLYYYGARYYDPTIGRFISPDTIVPDPINPQAFNRYTYVYNNPVKYRDPSGHTVKFFDRDPYLIELTQAWELFADVCPTSAKEMSESSTNYYISSNPLTKLLGLEEIRGNKIEEISFYFPGDEVTQIFLIGTDTINNENGIVSIAGTYAHEDSHRQGGIEKEARMARENFFQSDTIQEMFGVEDTFILDEGYVDVYDAKQANKWKSLTWPVLGNVLEKYGDPYEYADPNERKQQNQDEWWWFVCVEEY